MAPSELLVRSPGGDTGLGARACVLRLGGRLKPWVLRSLEFLLHDSTLAINAGTKS